MLKNIKFLSILICISFLIASCGPSACDCIEQFNYYHQDGGMLKLDQDKLTTCVEKFKDNSADYFPEDIETAEKNARSKCSD